MVVRRRRAPMPLRIVGMLCRWYWRSVGRPLTPEQELERQTFSF